MILLYSLSPAKTLQQLSPHCLAAQRYEVGDPTVQEHWTTQPFQCLILPFQNWYLGPALWEQWPCSARLDLEESKLSEQKKPHDVLQTPISHVYKRPGVLICFLSWGSEGELFPLAGKWSVSKNIYTVDYGTAPAGFAQIPAPPTTCHHWRPKSAVCSPPGTSSQDIGMDYVMTAADMQQCFSSFFFFLDQIKCTTCNVTIYQCGKLK